MITLALVFIFALVIIFLMRLTPEAPDGTNNFPFFGLKRGKAHATAAGAGQDLLFQEFCRKRCRYRFVCLQKNRAGRNGTCREFELSSNALW